MSKIFSGIGTTVLGAVATVSAVGIYSAIYKIPYIMVLFFSPISQALYPHISVRFSNSFENGCKTVITAAKLVIPAFALAGFAIILLRKQLILIAFGKEYLEYSSIIIPLVLWMLFSVINNFMGIQFLVASGNQKLYSHAFTIGSLITVGLNILLGLIFGIYGVSAAAPIGEVSLAILLYFGVKKQNKEKIKMKKVMLVFGTRPEAIKMCPLVNELKKRKELQTVVCVTGQHRQMLDMVLEAFSVTPDYDLSIMKNKQTLFDVTTNILNRIKEVLEKERPDVVLVHGDTSTTFVTALACFYLQIPVGHVEAGLRTYNIYSPYPEEFNRQAVSIISKFNFAPTELSKQNLLKEGKKSESIYVTGNTAIDALKTTVSENYAHPELEWAKKVVLL